MVRRGKRGVDEVRVKQLMGKKQKNDQQLFCGFAICKLFSFAIFGDYNMKDFIHDDKFGFEPCSLKRNQILTVTTWQS